jgi:hypothetical protein
VTEPWIGDENADDPGICTYSPAPERPVCGLPATVHVLTESAIHGVVGLASCDEHMFTARAAGPYISEHPYGPGCSNRPARWHGDHCCAVIGGEA